MRQAKIRHAVTATGQFSEPDVIHVEGKDNKDQYLIRVQEISTVDDATTCARGCGWRSSSRWTSAPGSEPPG